jgi:FkbH-like protein
MKHPLEYPFDPAFLMRKKTALRRELLAKAHLMEKRIAILGGSTTAEVKDMLELFLLKAGIKPQFYESEYNKYYEDLNFDNPQLRSFNPELIYIHTSSANLVKLPSIADTPQAAEAGLQSEFGRFRSLWQKADSQYHCPVIQNNFELPLRRVLGNLDAVDPRGHTHYVGEMNRLMAAYALEHPGLHIHDLNTLAAWFGLERWHDRQAWFMYKYAMAFDAIPSLAHSVAGMILAVYGLGKKALVLDLDNTLWGGVIGDDGVQGIQIGKETPEAEAHTDFQGYARDLGRRGIVLAVSSKNEHANAEAGLAHPDSVLKRADFAAFRANWDPKHENIRAIARELNLGLDSLVFADDNPAERELVRAQTPDVAVPELGDDPSRYAGLLDRAGYFETVSLSAEDLQRGAMYASNRDRQEAESGFATYGDYLDSLRMVAEILPFSALYLDRITQLTNKSNQFNLTTRRYTQPEMEAVAADPSRIHLYGRLADTFGDNGLVSVLIGKVQGDALDVELWLMSCRVLKRGMEHAMLDALVAQASARGLKRIKGSYFRTAKNGMVEDFYGLMGFAPLAKSDNGDSTWTFEIPADYAALNLHIRVNP